MKKHDNSTTATAVRQENFDSALEQILRKGARELLVQALESEIEEHLTKYASYRDAQGHRYVVRNGYQPEREIITGMGAIPVKKPRVHDRSGQHVITSAILPKFLRRVPSIDNLLPVLYLKGISTGDFPTALGAILGDSVSDLSATNIVRLTQVWETEYGDWGTRDLSGKRYVYFWVDGIYCKVRLDEERQCILVIIGATSDGKKELVAISDDYRESKQIWKEVLLEWKRLRGYNLIPLVIQGKKFVDGILQAA